MPTRSYGSMLSAENRLRPVQIRAMRDAFPVASPDAAWLSYFRRTAGMGIAVDVMVYMAHGKE